MRHGNSRRIVQWPQVRWKLHLRCHHIWIWNPSIGVRARSSASSGCRSLITGKCGHRWRYDNLLFFTLTDPTQNRSFDRSAHNTRTFSFFLLNPEVVPMFDKVSFLIIQCTSNELRLGVRLRLRLDFLRRRRLNTRECLDLRVHENEKG